MIWIVRVALERPYTFIVMSLLIFIIGPMAAIETPTDIFPNIGIPVIGVAWQYTGLPPDQMAGRIITPYERILTTTVNDIEHIESTSLPGIGIVKIYFQPNVDIRTATAQVTSISQTVLKQMPPGTTPPLILNYNASTVPIIQLANTSKTLSEQQILDLVAELHTPGADHGAGCCHPLFVWRPLRQVQVDLDPQELQSTGLSAQDVARRHRQPEPDPASGQRENRPAHIHGAAQRRRRNHPGSERPAHQDGEWRHDLHPRRRPCARRLAAAAEHCACRRRTRRAADHPQDGFGVYACGRAGREGCASEMLATLPSDLKVAGIERPVPVRESRHSRRDPRRHHRGGADLRDDPALSGQLALHHYHRDVDSACRAERDHRLMGRSATHSTS